MAGLRVLGGRALPHQGPHPLLLVRLGPRVRPGDDGGGAAGRHQPKTVHPARPGHFLAIPRGTRASARLHPGAGSPRLVRQSLADAIGSAGPRPQRACPTAPFGTGGAARPGAPTRLQPGGGRSVQPPPTPSGTEGPAAWPVRAAPGETSSTAPARPAGSRPPPFRPRPISGDPDTPISPAPAVRRDLAFGEGDGGSMGQGGRAGDKVCGWTAAWKRAQGCDRASDVRAVVRGRNGKARRSWSTSDIQSRKPIFWTSVNFVEELQIA